MEDRIWEPRDEDYRNAVDLIERIKKLSLADSRHAEREVMDRISELVPLIEQLVYRCALMIDSRSADDLVQEFWRKFISSLHRPKEHKPIGNLGGLVYNMVLQVYLDRGKKRENRISAVEFDEQRDSPALPKDGGGRRQSLLRDIDLLHQALDALDKEHPRYYKLILLETMPYYALDRSGKGIWVYPEGELSRIAEKYGVKLNSIRGIRFRCIVFIRRYFKDREQVARRLTS